MNNVFVQLPILHVRSIKETLDRRVWKVQLADSFPSRSKFSILKQYSSSHTLAYQTEKTVFSTFSSQTDHNPPVPDLVRYSDSEHLLLMSWCGNQTLEDLARNQQSVAKSNRIVSEILSAYSRLELAFSSINVAATVNNTLFDFEKTSQTGFRIFNLLLTKRVQPSVLAGRWEELMKVLQQAPMTFGPLDYQAKNIVLNNQLKPYFIDFESVGWDWPARRLVQYLTSLGAGHSDGQFFSLLNRKVLAESTDKNTLRQFDGHIILFYLIMIDRIVRAVARPESGFAQILMNEWGNLRNRYYQALNQLRTIVLSDWAVTRDLRRWLS